MSSEVQRLIRKMQPKGPRSFDEHVWPIYVAITVLFSYLVGVIVSVLRFNDPRVHANATTWLVTLTIVAILGMFCVRFLKQRLLKRTIVLSLLLSLIVNLSLLILMAWTSILYRPWQENEAKVAVQKKREDVVVPEYPLFNEDPKQRVPQEYERPVDTGEPDAEKRVELTRQSTIPEVELTERPPIPHASTSEQQQITSTPKRFETPSAPRQSQTASKLSRQMLQSELAVDRAVNRQVTESVEQAVEQRSEATPARPQTQKRLVEMERPPTELQADRAPQRAAVAELTRQETEETETVAMSALPTLKRRLKRPQQVPTTQTPVDERLTKPKRTERDVDPSSTLVQQQRTTSSPEEMTSVDLQPKVAVDLQRQTRLDRPESTTLSPAIERATLARTSTSVAQVDAPEVARRDTAASEVKPTAERFAKQSNSQASDAAAATPKTQPAEPQPKISTSTLARARTENEPSVSETLDAAKSPTRSTHLASKATQTNTQVEGAVAVDSNNLNPAAMAEPSRMALSRSSIGVAGVGDASNLERGVAAPESPVSIATASANRAEAQQEMAEAFALSPSTRSPSRQMRATASQPQTSMQAQSIDTPMVPGATAPAEAAASSAATVEHAPSNAAEASITAAKGTTEVDLGPTRIAADTGNGRAEGGGQPEISMGELPRALSRANSIAGASGRPTSAETSAASPAADDLASNADTTGPAAEAATTDIAHAIADRGVAGHRAGETASPTTNDLANLATVNGQRAEDDESVTVSQIAAGGNRQPGKRSRGLKVKTDVASSVPSLAAAEASSGSSRGVSLDAQGTAARQSATGLPGVVSDEIGATEGERVVAGNPGDLPTLVFPRQDEGGDSDLGSLAASELNRGAPERSQLATVTGGSTDVELDPEELAVNAPGTNQDDSLGSTGLDEPTLSEVTRRGGAALPVDIEAPDGPGGLGSQLAANAGILSRSASPESDFVSMQPSRFLSRTRPGASINSKTDVVTPTKAYRRRIIRRGDELAGERGLPSPKTEAAIELGLVFLSKYQSADGSWSFNNFADGKAELPADENALIVSDTGATGLSLLSFLGAGYHHKDDKYQEHVKNGLDFLVQHQRDDGDLYIDQDANSSRSAWLYSHAIATIALCEAYGMTQDPELRRAAQKAVNFVAESQHPTRGGWRYSPAYGADTSVTGWMTMALKSGELAGLTIDQNALTKVQHWMDLAQASDEQPYLFRYNPYASDTENQRHGLKPTRAMTAVGLLMRLYTGWSRGNPKMVLGAETLVQNLPETGTSDMPRRDTYYWYYATQVMYHMGGEYWQKWNQALHPMLTRSQQQEGPLAGSWDPQVPVPDRWGTYGGRLYVTTMNLLSLEVFYRHLPIYEDSAK